MLKAVLGTCATFSATVILTRTKKVGKRCGGAKVKKWRGGSGTKKWCYFAPFFNKFFFLNPYKMQC